MLGLPIDEMIEDFRDKLEKFDEDPCDETFSNLLSESTGILAYCENEWNDNDD